MTTHLLSRRFWNALGVCLLVLGGGAAALGQPTAPTAPT